MHATTQIVAGYLAMTVVIVVGSGCFGSPC